MVEIVDVRLILYGWYGDDDDWAIKQCEVRSFRELLRGRVYLNDRTMRKFLKQNLNFLDF